MKRVCVFCGSSVGAKPAYAVQAAELGKTLARKGIELVYGGGNVGLMGVLADAVLHEGGNVIGVIPQFLRDKEVAHLGLTKLYTVGSMHERKALMAELSDAFIAMPGGFGTFEEFCEIVTWSQLGLHKKPCALFNVEGFFDSFNQFINHATAERFIRTDHVNIVLSESQPAQLIEGIKSWKPVHTDKWIKKSQT